MDLSLSSSSILLQLLGASFVSQKFVRRMSLLVYVMAKKLVARRKRLFGLPRRVFVCRGNKIIHAHIQAKKQSQQIKQLVHMDEMLDMDETLTSFLFSTLLYFTRLNINSQKGKILHMFVKIINEF